MRRNLLTKGQLANICDMPLKTLERYREAGLIQPALIEGQEEAYGVEEMERLLLVNALKGLSFSPEAIKQAMERDEAGGLIGLVHEKKKEVEEKMEELRKIERQLNGLISTYGTFGDGTFHPVHLKLFEPRHLFFLTAEETSFAEAYQQLTRLAYRRRYIHRGIKMAVLNGSERMKYGFELSQNIPMASRHLLKLEGGLYASLMFEGDQEALASGAHDALNKWLSKNGYQKDGPLIEIYHVTRDGRLGVEPAITEIQVLVRG